MTELVIAIVSYNVRADLERCLRSLHDHPPSVGHEIVVVDNASSDGSAEAVRRAWPGVRVLQSPVNLGFAGANNWAIRSSASELILLLNGDTVVPRGAIDALVAALRRHPEAAVAGPRLIDERGEPEISFGRMIGPFNELRQKVVGRLYERRVPVIRRWIDRRTRRVRFPDWVSGACLLVRRADADAVGLLDERFFMYGEDVDFCAAIRQQGRRILFAPAVEVVHLRGRSAASAPVATQAAYRKSQVAFYRKHHPAWVPLLRLYLRVRGKPPCGPC